MSDPKVESVVDAVAPITKSDIIKLAAVPVAMLMIKIGVMKAMRVSARRAAEEMKNSE